MRLRMEPALKERKQTPVVEGERWYICSRISGRVVDRM